MNIIAHMVHSPPIHNDCFVNEDFIIIIIIIIIIITPRALLTLFVGVAAIIYYTLIHSLNTCNFQIYLTS